MSEKSNLFDHSLDIVVESNVIPDIRHIENGNVIPTISYSDQPFMVEANDGAWVCCVTTGYADEGKPGQHIITMRSTDKGKTWEQPVTVEPKGSPENSWGVLLNHNGRIYIFYCFNSENIREIKADNPPYGTGVCTRMDSLGDYVFRYSDDNGKSWSEKRYVVPVREFDIDTNNPYKGKIRYFWNVGKPFILGGSVYASVHKVGGIGYGFFTSSEGVLLKSDNFLTEKDPDNVTWETLPDGKVGLRTPEGGGPVSEEHSYSVLSDGSIYCVYRTADGHPTETYSRDGGHTFEAPQYKRYADGRLVKNPRAANFAWKCQNGKYLYWFHNHSGCAYEDRNPVWVMGGIETDGENGRVILWSQPEILLYTDDIYVRMSYPDLIESDGGYYITETNKDIARVHQIPNAFLEKLWSQAIISTKAVDGLICSTDKENPAVLLDGIKRFTVRDHSKPDYSGKDLRSGVSLDFWFDAGLLTPNTELFTNMSTAQTGFSVRFNSEACFELVMSDGQTTSLCQCEPLEFSAEKHHLSVIIDGGPKIVSFVADCRFCDGGQHKQFGFSRFSPQLMTIDGRLPDGTYRDLDYIKTQAQTVTLRITDKAVTKLCVYNRAIMTTEAISNYRAGE